jgi:hypothetical protein
MSDPIHNKMQNAEWLKSSLKDLWMRITIEQALGRI